MDVASIITNVWGAVPPYDAPPSSKILRAMKQSGVDEVGLIIEVDEMMTKMERAANVVSRDYESQCSICLLPLMQANTSMDSLGGKANRRKRSRLHQKMKVEKREFMPSSGDDVLEVFPNCGHHFHSHCVRAYRQTDAMNFKCPNCRAPAPHTCRTDVPLLQDQCLVYHQLSSLKRAYHPCFHVATGKVCPNQSECRFSHWCFDGNCLVQQDDVQPRSSVRLIPAGDEENWEDDVEDLPPPTPRPSAFTRSGRVPRIPGARGWIPVVIIATGEIRRFPPDAVLLDSRSANPRFSTQLPSRNQR